MFISSRSLSMTPTLPVRSPTLPAGTVNGENITNAVQITANRKIALLAFHDGSLLTSRPGFTHILTHSLIESALSDNVILLTMTSLPDELIDLKHFHGHLGPYAVIGYRMGLIAREMFPDRIYAILHSGTERPLSCMADGVQLSSCCTLGKGNIILEDKGEAIAEFSDGFKHLRIDLLSDIRARIDAETTHATEEMISAELYDTPDSSLFIISKDSSDPFGR